MGRVTNQANKRMEGTVQTIKARTSRSYPMSSTFAFVFIKQQIFNLLFSIFNLVLLFSETITLNK
jgi:hypothetical protein